MHCASDNKYVCVGAAAYETTGVAAHLSSGNGQIVVGALADDTTGADAQASNNFVLKQRHMKRQELMDTWLRTATKCFSAQRHMKRHS